MSLFIGMAAVNRILFDVKGEIAVEVEAGEAVFFAYLFYFFCVFTECVPDEV